MSPTFWNHYIWEVCFPTSRIATQNYLTVKFRLAFYIQLCRFYVFHYYCIVFHYISSIIFRTFKTLLFVLALPLTVIIIINILILNHYPESQVITRKAMIYVVMFVCHLLPNLSNVPSDMKSRISSSYTLNSCPGVYDKRWAPHLLCSACLNGLRAWRYKRLREIPFAVTMIWRVANNHFSDCY